MKKKDLLLFSRLFSFKTVVDEFNNEYVIFNDNPINEIQNISDKTQFEATENHIHLYENVKKKDFDELNIIGTCLGSTLLCALKKSYPSKKFFVYVSFSVADSLIIRFHQKWPDEESYYEEYQNTSEEKLLIFSD